MNEHADKSYNLSKNKNKCHQLAEICKLEMSMSCVEVLMPTPTLLVTLIYFQLIFIEWSKIQIFDNASIKLGIFQTMENKVFFFSPEFYRSHKLSLEIVIFLFWYQPQ